MQSKRIEYKKTSHGYAVPQTTFERRVRGNNLKDWSSFKHLHNLKPVFLELKEEFDKYVAEMETLFFGLSSSLVRRLAYPLSENNKLIHMFHEATNRVRNDWLHKFIKRHPALSLWSPEPTSTASAGEFNKDSVAKFFDLLRTTIKFPPTRIFNCDGTRTATVPKRQAWVHVLKERRQVGMLTSAERGTLVAVKICVFASDNFIPPFVYFL